jgi:hypothetical protein
MDETSINFVPEIKNTLEKRGTTKVYLRNFKGEKKRVTVCLSITASGKKLKPLIIFKGKSKATVEK